MSVVLSIIVVLFLSGCSLTREVPPSVTYRLDPQNSLEISLEQGCREKVIRITLVQSPQSLRSDSIYYSDTHAKSYQYTRARWQTAPAEQFQQIIESAVTGSELFKGVIPFKSLAKEDWLLEVRLEAMDQQIADDGSSTTVLRLYAVIIDRYSREILAEKRFIHTEDSEISDVMTAVASWSRATGAFEEALTLWLASECKS